MMLKSMSCVVALLMSFAIAGTASAEITIKGKNDQQTRVDGAVTNIAIGSETEAEQNLSSNVGSVSIGGDNKQVTEVEGAVTNIAIGSKSKAMQNLSSNRSL
ncbi:hypothetical protein [Limnobacter sp.]|uniref:hypothetical protein n=1 Tax=Limnobacter sp. TaxID=2003368 RepID=UPI002FE3B073